MTILRLKSLKRALLAVVVIILSLFGISSFELSKLESVKTFTENYFVISAVRILGSLPPIESPLYRLKVVSPAKLIKSSDGEVTVTLEELFSELEEIINRQDQQLGHTSYSVELSLSSESFRVIPSDTLYFPVLEGHTEHFLISPTSVGIKKLLLKSQIVGGSNPLDKRTFTPDLMQTRTITVGVIESPTIIGLSEKTLNAIQIISLSIGFPSLLLLLINLLISSRKKKLEEREKQKSKIILPIW